VLTSFNRKLFKKPGTFAFTAAVFGAIFLLKKDQSVLVPEEVAIRDERTISAEKPKI
jgi:hypothetical protein